MPVKKNSTLLLKRMIRDLRQMNGYKIRWGFFNESKHPHPRGEDSIPIIAQWVHNGHDLNVPPRPFFDNSVQDNYKATRNLIDRLQRKVLKGKLTPFKKVNMIGEFLVNNLKKSIVELDTPTLKDATIAARESRGIYTSAVDDPLIETGAMLNAAKYKITKVR